MIAGSQRDTYRHDYTDKGVKGGWFWTVLDHFRLRSALKLLIAKFDFQGVYSIALDRLYLVVQDLLGVSVCC